MIHDFDAWAANRAETNSFSELEDSTLAVEATFYLNRLLSTTPSKEPLLSALGGQPFALKAYISNELAVLRNARIKPLFVFDGLDVGKKFRAFSASDYAAKMNAEAWELYNQHLADKAVETFGDSGYARPEDHYRLLQSILKSAGVEFMVAPYSAHGQIAYLMKRGTEYIDAVAGSSDLLLYDVDKVITNLDFDREEFTWVRRQNWIDDLGMSSAEQFVDACMLSGTNMLEPLPILTNSHPNRKIQHLPQVLELMKIQGKSGIAVVKHAQDEPTMRRAEYLDRYRRSRLAVKHQVILTSSGKVEPFEQENVPADLHEVIGQRLPEELYYYLSAGIIGPRVLNYLTSQQIFETAPADGGDSEDYHTLVQDKLTPIRATTLSLLSHSLARAYQHHNVRLHCWFDPQKETIIRLGDVPSPTPVIGKWNVPESVFAERLPSGLDGKASLSFAVKSLKDESFAASTISQKSSSKETGKLETRSEIMTNTVWRFLHLREYVNDKHELTAWGKVLDAVLPAAEECSTEVEEAALLAVELLRLGVLNSTQMFSSYTGAPLRGTDTDKDYCLLVSRIACLGKLNHRTIGFTGPLSRNLLAYSSMISAVRRVLRDLIEMCLATLLLNGDADRESVDLTDIGLSLPFLLPLDCSLGIAIKHYLDDLAGVEVSKLDTTKEEVKERGPKEWFPHSVDFSGDLDKAFALWDAIFSGVKKAGELELITAKDKTKWTGANSWVALRRSDTQNSTAQKNGLVGATGASAEK